LGDRITVQTIRGLKGNVIGRLPDGRAMLFGRDSPYRSMLGPDQLVECNVIYISQRYVIVDPIREPEPIGDPKPIEGKEPPDLDGGELLEKLRRVSEKGEWETAIVAGALLYIIERFDDFKEILSKRSSQNTDVVAEEPPIEHPSGSPESEFLRYLEEERREDDLIPTLEGNQEGREDDLISTNLEDFGVIVDLPKDLTLLTMGQTRYLKENHLKGIDGYDKIEKFSNFFVEASALKRREYGNVFYASRGTNPWNKVHKITVQRGQG